MNVNQNAYGSSTYYIISLLIPFLFHSCSSWIYFTNETRTEIETGQILPNQIQYYISKNVKLTKEVSSGNAMVKSGKIKYKGGKYINTIKLKKLTPGICTGFRENELQITFEKRGNESLSFCVPSAQNQESIYSICANDSIGPIPTVKYGTDKYLMQSKRGNASLVVKKSSIIKYNEDSRKMKGRRLK